MKLSKNQIGHLFDFTKKHYVEWYDVQIELVDHLANGIEAQWKENPKLPFEDALKIEFKKFGVFGFMDVIAQKEKSMTKKYRNFMWSEAKGWFKLPQILSTVVFYLFFMSAFQLPYSIFILFIAHMVFFVWVFSKTMKARKIFNKRKSSSKKWLLEYLIFQQAAGGSFLGSVGLFNFYVFIEHLQASLPLIMIISLILTLNIIFTVVGVMVLPKKADQLLKQTYPNFVTNQ